MLTSVSTDFFPFTFASLLLQGLAVWWAYLAERLIAVRTCVITARTGPLRSTWTAACALNNKTLTFKLPSLQPRQPRLQGAEGTAGGATAAMEAALVPAPRPGTASRRGAFPFPSVPARSGPRATARVAEAAALPGAGGVMAAPAASATPPKKIVAPTVSQINAEFVTQVGWPRRGGAWKGRAGGRLPVLGNLTAAWALRLQRTAIR